QLLDARGAPERVGRVGAAGLVGENLLLPQRDPNRTLGRERERLVEPVRVNRLRAPADRRERLHGHARDVVLRLLRRQGRAAGLGVEAERLRLWVLGAEALAHDPGPEPSRGAELGDLLEEVRSEERRVGKEWRGGGGEWDGREKG